MSNNKDDEGDSYSNRDPFKRRKKMQDMLDDHYKKRGLVPPIIKPKIDWDTELTRLIKEGK